MSDEIKMVPAVCTQCGGTLEVDPSNEKAKCPYCGTEFAVEKAVNNYNVQHATIGHADNVNIDMSGTVDSVLDFVGKQMSESREMRKEEKKRYEEESKDFRKSFFKFGIIFIVVFFAFALILYATGFFKDDGSTSSGSSYENESGVDNAEDDMFDDDEFFNDEY